MSTRLSYLKPGEAVLGMKVCIEKSRNKLLVGRIVEIEEAPARQAPRPRRCAVKVQWRPAPVWELEDRLLAG